MAPPIERTLWLPAAMTPNQLVAYNFRRARLLRGLNQDQAAERLEPYIGTRWSQASMSAVERSATDEGRPRVFTANDIAAFALAFDLPITWFFLPPETLTAQVPTGAEYAVPELEIRAGENTVMSVPEFLELFLGATGSPEAQLVQARLDQSLAGSKGPRTAGQRDLADHAERLVQASIVEALGDVPAWSRTLRELADHLDNVEADTTGSKPKRRKRKR